MHLYECVLCMMVKYSIAGTQTNPLPLSRSYYTGSIAWVHFLPLAPWNVNIKQLLSPNHGSKLVCILYFYQCMCFIWYTWLITLTGTKNHRTFSIGNYISWQLFCNSFNDLQGLLQIFPNMSKLIVNDNKKIF